MTKLQHLLYEIYFSLFEIGFRGTDARCCISSQVYYTNVLNIKELILTRSNPNEYGHPSSVLIFPPTE